MGDNFLMGFFNSKCKFCKKCPNYQENSNTCNKTNGMYYNDGTEPAGCYLKMEGINGKE